MSIRTTLALLAAALTFTGTASAASTTSVADGADVRATPGTSSYLPGDHHDEAANKRLERQIAAAQAQAKQDRANGVRRTAWVTTIYYDASRAPSFADEIAQSSQIWNNSVSNVRLVENPSRATLRFYEQSSRIGSYYQGNWHGRGIIVIDPRQARTYDPLRIVAHETGHALGLPDRYQQPCSKLMSGGGPGPSCTNPYPDQVEANQVDSLWRNGVAALQPAA